MYTPNGSSLNVWKIAFQDSDTDGCCSQVMTTTPAAHNPQSEGAAGVSIWSNTAQSHPAATKRQNAMQSAPSAQP